MRGERFPEAAWGVWGGPRPLQLKYYQDLRSNSLTAWIAPRIMA